MFDCPITQIKIISKNEVPDAKSESRQLTDELQLTFSRAQNDDFDDKLTMPIDEALALVPCTGAYESLESPGKLDIELTPYCEEVDNRYTEVMKLNITDLEW